MPRTRTLEDLTEDLEGRKVLVRVDFNVPLDPEGGVADGGRVEAALPTLEHLRSSGASVILVSHLGRPGGKPDPAASLAPVAGYLADRLNHPVPLIQHPPGSRELRASVEALEPGNLVLLENIRFHSGETDNDPELGKALADLAEGFVGDAFGTAHRAHASNVGAARAIRDRGGPAVAGLLMAKELHFLGDVLRDPARPFVGVMGGAKISGKIDLIRAILPRVDRLLIGGAMANTFFRALGLETGESLVEADRVTMASELLEEAGDRLLLPVDCVVADRIAEDADPRTRDRADVRSGERIGDIGPRSRELFAKEVEGAATVLWNGPMGVFEMPPFAAGTQTIAESLARAADRGCVVVVGGGDSAAAAEAAGVTDRMTHVSTGGGAALDLLAGNELPGVAVLETTDGDPTLDERGA